MRYWVSSVLSKVAEEMSLQHGQMSFARGESGKHHGRLPSLYNRKKHLRFDRARGRKKHGKREKEETKAAAG